MPNWYVTVNRPSITAATPQAAADISVSTPLRSSDIVFVKELTEETIGLLTTDSIFNPETP